MQSTLKTSVFNGPAAAWAYGLAGLIPFAASAALSIWGLGDAQRFGQIGLVAYGAVILSFLGGARWGLEIGRTPVRLSVISLSMLPSLAGFACLLAPAFVKSPTLWGVGLSRLQDVILSLAFVAQWFWDVRYVQSPVWYPALRTVLTLGGVVALGAAVLR